MATKTVVILVPTVREVYMCHSLGQLMYSSWNDIYSAYIESDEEKMKRKIYYTVRGEVKVNLTSYQTNIIWDKLENEVPEDLKYGTKNTLKEVMSNISEKEIEYVERALEYF